MDVCVEDGKAPGGHGPELVVSVLVALANCCVSTVGRCGGDDDVVGALFDTSGRGSDRLGLGLGKFIIALALFPPKAPIGLGLRLFMRDDVLPNLLSPPKSVAGATMEMFCSSEGEDVDVSTAAAESSTVGTE